MFIHVFYLIFIIDYGSYYLLCFKLISVYVDRIILALIISEKYKTLGLVQTSLTDTESGPSLTDTKSNLAKVDEFMDSTLKTMENMENASGEPKTILLKLR